MQALITADPESHGKCQEGTTTMRPMLTFLLPGVLALVLHTSPALIAQTGDPLSQGQTVYVSVYSNILTGPRGNSFPLDATLVVRNTDMTDSLTVSTVDFYDTEGNFVRSFIDQPMSFRPLQTRYIHVPEKAAKGGIGANFMIRWSSLRPVNAPVIECVMIGVRSGQGISFLTSGKVIQEHRR